MPRETRVGRMGMSVCPSSAHVTGLMIREAVEKGKVSGFFSII